MQVLSPGVYRVADGETVSIDIRVTGANTLLLVNHALQGHGGGPVAASPLRLVFHKNQAPGPSDIPGAKSAFLTLTFTFNSTQGGRYDFTLTGSAGGTDSDFVTQSGNLPAPVTYLFHVV